MKAKILPSYLHAFYSRGRVPGFEQVTIFKNGPKFSVQLL